MAFAWSCARWMQVMVPHLRSLTSWFGSSPMIRVDPSRSESIRKHMPTQLVSGINWIAGIGDWLHRISHKQNGEQKRGWRWPDRPPGVGRS